MKLSLMSLNLKGFSDRENRFHQIIKILREKNPDIIVFQEVQSIIDNKQDKNLLNIINKQLNYKYEGYSNCFNYSKDYGKGILINKITGTPDNIEEGLGIISKIPFSFSKIELSIQKGIDRWPRIVMTCNFNNFSLVNIHYSPKGIESTYPEWEETPKSSILVGDFNMKPHEIEKIKGNYISSYDFKEYVSYPSEGNTFDYCLLRDGKFNKVETFESLSDHVGLYCEIEF